MGVLDWIIILLVACALVLALRIYLKSGKCSCGSGCCGDCAACRRAGASCSRAGTAHTDIE